MREKIPIMIMTAAISIYQVVSRSQYFPALENIGFSSPLDKLGKPSFKKNRNFMKSFHKRGGGSLRFHTLIQISYILLYTSSFTVKIWIRISQIQHGGGGHHFVKVFHKIPVFFKGWLPLDVYFHQWAWRDVLAQYTLASQNKFAQSPVFKSWFLF